MPWQKGQSGNPQGRPKEGKSLTATLSEALDKPHRGNQTKREALVAKFIELALDGQTPAITGIFDRLEGKPVQPVLDETPKANLFEGWPEEQVRGFGELMRMFKDDPQGLQLLLAQLRIGERQEVKG